MTLVFKGIKRETRSRGCNCHRSRGDRISTIKPFHLPSGATVVFRVGQTQEVRDEDGDFLLKEFPRSFELV